MDSKLYDRLLGLMAPKVLTDHFVLTSFVEESEATILVFEERDNLIPKPLLEKKVVLNGFLKPDRLT